MCSIKTSIDMKSTDKPLLWDIEICTFDAMELWRKVIGSERKPSLWWQSFWPVVDFILTFLSWSECYSKVRFPSLLPVSTQKQSMWFNPFFIAQLESRFSASAFRNVHFLLEKNTHFPFLLLTFNHFLYDMLSQWAVAPTLLFSEPFQTSG